VEDDDGFGVDAEAGHDCLVGWWLLPIDDTGCSAGFDYRGWSGDEWLENECGACWFVIHDELEVIDFCDVEEVGEDFREIEGALGWVDISAGDYFVSGIEDDELGFGGIVEIEF